MWKTVGKPSCFLFAGCKHNQQPGCRSCEVTCIYGNGAIHVSCLLAVSTINNQDVDLVR